MPFLSHRKKPFFVGFSSKEFFLFPLAQKHCLRFSAKFFLLPTNSHAKNTPIVVIFALLPTSARITGGKSVFRLLWHPFTASKKKSEATPSLRSALFFVVCPCGCVVVVTRRYSVLLVPPSPPRLEFCAPPSRGRFGDFFCLVHSLRFCTKSKVAKKRLHGCHRARFCCGYFVRFAHKSHPSAAPSMRIGARCDFMVIRFAVFCKVNVLGSCGRPRRISSNKKSGFIITRFFRVCRVYLQFSVFSHRCRITPSCS